MADEDCILEHAVCDVAEPAVSCRKAGQVQTEQPFDFAEAQHKVFPESVPHKVLEFRVRGLRCPVLTVEVRFRGV